MEDVLHIKLKPEAEKLIAEICVRAYLRHLDQEEARKQAAAAQQMPESSNDGEVA